MRTRAADEQRVPDHETARKVKRPITLEHFQVRRARFRGALLPGVCMLVAAGAGVIALQGQNQPERVEKVSYDAVSVAFPKTSPALIMDVPKFFSLDESDERLIVREGEDDAFLYIAAVPPSDGVEDLIAAEEWLPKKAAQLLQGQELGDAKSLAGLERDVIARHFARRIRFEHSKLSWFEMYVFTLDGKKYFYAHYQDRTENTGKFDPSRPSISHIWFREALKSVRRGE